MFVSTIQVGGAAMCIVCENGRGFKEEGEDGFRRLSRKAQSNFHYCVDTHLNNVYMLHIHSLAML